MNYKLNIPIVRAGPVKTKLVSDEGIGFHP